MEIFIVLLFVIVIGVVVCLVAFINEYGTNKTKTTEELDDINTKLNRLKNK